MGFFNLVQQYHRIGTAPDFFRELAAFFVADIARRRTQNPRHGVLFHIFGHIQPHQRVFIVKQKSGQRFGGFGLAHAGGPQEHKRSQRPAFLGNTRAGAADRVGNRANRRLLPDHPAL